MSVGARAGHLNDAGDRAEIVGGRLGRRSIVSTQNAGTFPEIVFSAPNADHDDGVESCRQWERADAPLEYFHGFRAHRFAGCLERLRRAVILGYVPLARYSQAASPKVGTECERTIGHRAARGNAADKQAPRIEAICFCGATHGGDEKARVRTFSVFPALTRGSGRPAFGPRPPVPAVNTGSIAGSGAQVRILVGALTHRT